MASQIDSRASCTAIGLRSTPKRHRDATSRLQRRALRGCHVVRVPRPFFDQCVLDNRAEIPARRDQKRTAAHGGIENLELQDLVRRAALHERNGVVHAGERIWMSLNGGQTFTQAQSPADGIRSVEISATGVIYVASYQGRVFKSVDHGNTWTNCGAPWLQGAFVVTLGIDPKSYPNAQDHLFLQATDSSTSPGTSATWRTVDGCATWTQSGTGDPASPSNVVRRYVVSPTDPNRVLASAYDGIYRSTNGGASWTNVLPYGTDWIEFDPRNPGYVVALGAFGRIMRSTDGGDNWDTFFGAELQVAGNATFAFDRQIAGRMIVTSWSGAYLSHRWRSVLRPADHRAARGLHR